jgi:hypothetical protein
MNKYYSLVSGMHEFFFSSPAGVLEKKLPPPNIFLPEVHMQLSKEDAHLLHWLQWPYTLECLWQAMNSPDDFVMDERSGYSEEECFQFAEDPDLLPDWLSPTISEYKEGRKIFPEYSNRNQLNIALLQEVRKSENKYLTAWFKEDTRIRDTLTALSLTEKGHEQDESDELHFLGDDEIADTLTKNLSSLSSLSSFGPEIKHILNQSDASVLEREWEIDQIRMEISSQIAFSDPFSINGVLDRCNRYLISYRWAQLNEESGRQRLEALVDKLISQPEMPI